MVVELWSLSSLWWFSENFLVLTIAKVNTEQINYECIHYDAKSIHTLFQVIKLKAFNYFQSFLESSSLLNTVNCWWYKKVEVIGNDRN